MTGFGFRYGALHRGPGTITPIGPVQTLTPGPAFNGIPGSGFGGSPPTRTGLTTPGQPYYGHMGVPTLAGTSGGTVAPAAAFAFSSDFLPDGMLSDDIFVAVKAEAFGDNATVIFNFEGSTATVGPNDRNRVTIDRYDDKTRSRMHVVKLSRAAWTTGSAEVWATVSVPGMADRVIGPIRQYLRTAPDRVISVGTGQPTVAGVSYPTLQPAILYASTSADPCIRIMFTSDLVIDGATSFGTTVANSNSRRGLITLEPNGHAVKAMRSTKGLFRPSCNATAWRDIEFDMTNIESVYHEDGAGVASNYRPMWLIGCDLHSSSRTELYHPGTSRNTSFTRYTVGLIGCYIHDIVGGDWISIHRFGNKIMRKSTDIFHIQGWTSATAMGGPTFAAANKIIDCTSEDIRTPILSLTGAYSGPGVGTFEVGGANHNSAGRSLVVKVDGAVVATYPISVTFGSGNYSITQLATAGSATANWVFTALDDTYRAAALGLEVGTTAVASGGTLTAALYAHGDAAQTNEGTQHDGLIIVDNEYEVTEAQVLFKLGVDRAFYNGFFRNNGYFRPNGTAKNYQFQISGRYYHACFDQNTHPNQTLALRYDMTGGLAFDAYCSIIGNIFEAVTEAGTAVAPPVIRANHAYGGGTLTGATQATSGGSAAADFPGLASPTFTRDDFLPAADSPLRGYAITPALRYDMGGVDRTGQAFKGAITNIEVADVELTALSSAFVLPEDAPVGAFAGYIFGRAAAATLSLIDNAGGRVALDGVRVIRGAVALDYEAATSHGFIVRQTLPDARYLDTPLTLAVTDVVETAISAVAANGWQATMITPADLSFASVPASRQGYNSSASAITIAESLVTTKRVRQPYPSQASLTTADAALNDYVYSTDTLPGATNNSTEVSPKPVATWVTPDRAVVGNSLVIDLVAFHRNGRAGKPVAAVTGTATDGTTTVTASTSTPIILGHAGDKNPVIGYRLTFDITTLTNQAAITVNGKVYPHIGGTASVLDSSAGVAGDRGFVPMVFWKETGKAGSPPYAYVNAGSGVDAVVDANGVASGNTKVSTTAATAAANPFATMLSAVNALKAATAVTGGFSTGCVIRIVGTVALDPSNFVSATYQNGGELVIEGLAGSTPVLTFGATNRNSYQTYLRIRNLAFNRTGAAAMGNGTTRLVLENVTMDGGSQGTAFTGTGTHAWLLGMSLTNPGTNLNFGTNQQLRLARGIACPVGFTIENWLTLGCAIDGPLLFTTVAARPPHGGMVAFNRLAKATGASILLQLGATTDINGFAFVQNVIEKIDTVNAATFRPSGDSDTGNITHLICWNNSFAGFGLYGRGNILYDETAATARTHKLQSFRGNIHVQMNHKSDIFRADGTRIGAWGYGHGVGCLGEFSQYVDAGPNLQSFRQDYPGMKASIGSSQTVRNDPLFTSYAGTTNSGTSPVAGAGGGTYTLQTGSPAIGVLTSAEEALPFDLAGDARDRGSLGAYR